MRRWLLCSALVALTALATPARLAAQQPPPFEVALAPIGTTRAPVGAVVFWRATVTGTTDPLLYRFQTAQSGLPLRLARDFNTRNYFEFVALDEGTHNVEVTARNAATGQAVTTTATFTVDSRVTNDPVVTATMHPLVALYSAPACEGQIRVRYAPQAGGLERVTPLVPCRTGRSTNFYVAGMYPDTTYALHHEVVAGPTVISGPPLTFRTGTATRFPPIVVLNSALPDAPDIVLHGMLMSTSQGTFPVATDLAGRPLWYYDRSFYGWQTGAHLLRPAAGGTMLLAMNEVGLQWQILREIDLVGNALRETTVPRVNEQLVARGDDPITAFHHEALRLDNGHTLVLGSVERLLTDVQGPGTVDVLGDAIIDLDPEWQVAWTWNAFDHLDPARVAVLGESCTAPADGCRPLKLATRANDWTHGNSIAYAAPDGNLLLSVRNQDWIVKIDYRNGTGTGGILWRLGRDGDFALEGGDPSLWFSHQHDASISGNRLLLYDNGNTRCEPQKFACQSRGQELALDESLQRANVVFNIPLGHYALLAGSAQRLPSGSYHFGSGWVYPGPHSEAIEVRPDGSRASTIATAIVYRSFRMRDLYTP